MKHLIKTKKFSRKGNAKALSRNLINNFVLNGKIKTTTTKAKYIKRIVEKLITIAKKQNTASLRLLISRMSKKSAYKLYYEIAPKMKERKGGYTKITKLPLKRKKDAAELSTIEFVE